MDGTVLGVPVNEWVNYSNNTQVWYSADNNILPVIKNEMAKQQDAVLYIVGIYDWVYNIKPLLFLKGVKKIISVRGMLHPGALTQKSFKKKAFLFLMKMWGWQRKVVFHVTDEGEREFVIRELGIRKEELGIRNWELGIGDEGSGIKNGEVMVAGNFPNLFSVLQMPEKEVGKLKLVSVGLISPMKNYLLVLEALKAVGSWQLTVGSGAILTFAENDFNRLTQQKAISPVQDDTLRQAQDNIEYNIYGPVKDADYWEACKEVIKNMPANIVVKYHGAIAPMDVEKTLAESHVFILPSKSENYGHSIIEALSAGRPVITSNATPWNALKEAKAGINVELAVGSTRPSGSSGRGQLAEAIGFFVNMRGDELDEWSKGAVDYVNKAIDVEEIRKAYLKMFGLIS